MPGPLIFWYPTGGTNVTVVLGGGTYSDSYSGPYSGVDLAITAQVLTPTISLSNAQVTPATIAATASVPTPTIVLTSAGAIATPATIPITASIPTPQISGAVLLTEAIMPTLLVEMDTDDIKNAAKLDDPTTMLDVSFLDSTPPTYPEVLHNSDDIKLVRSVSTHRGTSRELQRVEAGTASILLDNRDGRFTPFLTSSPYYPKILPMRRIRIRATWGPETHPVFQGFVESWPVTFPEDVDTVVQVDLVDGFTMLSRAFVSGDFPEQSSGERVSAILDAAIWPLVDRDINTGQVTVPAITLENVSALEHIQQIAHAEGGRFFMARDGTAVFRDRSFEAAPDIDLRAWADDGTGMSYRDLVLEFSDSLILNDVHLTRVGGTEMVSTDQASINQYGRRSLAESDLQLATDGDVQARADLMTERYAQPDLRIEQLVDDAMQHRLWERVLPREINDLAKVVESRTETAQVSSIEGIAHDIGPDTWTITLSVAPATITAFSFLDDPSGFLDSTAILGR